MRREFIVCLFLIVTTLGVFWQVQDHPFIYYDDGEYITDNRHVQMGLSGESASWAFTATYAANWHPLTWISHMLDYELYGLNPKGHHATNVLLHLANALLLFLVLRRMTGAVWRSGFAAALFALHPLHVESVAWVAERKDVLSALFWMLTLWAYAWYAERPGLARYALVVLTFACGLMAKPMLVTLPFVLLLLDYWPLHRFPAGPLGLSGGPLPFGFVHKCGQTSPAVSLVLEKMPLLLLSVVSSLITFIAQQAEGAVRSLEMIPIQQRAANAAVSYVLYVVKMMWPQDLALLYPLSTFPMWQVVGSVLLLVVISAGSVSAARRYPYLAVGWFWYLGTLVPVIGLVQVGFQSMADRYTYLPLIGLSIMAAWGAADITKKWRLQRLVLPVCTTAILAGSMICTWRQAEYWKSDSELWTHTLNVTGDNYVAHYNLGHVALAGRGDLAQAVKQYSEAVRLKPDYALAHNNLGVALERQGKLREAIKHYSEAVRIDPDRAEARFNLEQAARKLSSVSATMEQGLGR